MKRYIITILLLITTTALWGQSHIIAGKVVDQQTLEPLPFANVALFTTNDTLFYRGKSTDIDGSYTIGDVSSGTYLLRITMVGYQTFFKTIEITSDITLPAVKLSSGSQLDEVLITAARPIFTMDGEKNIYNTSDDPSIQSGTAIDALQNAPSIGVDAEGNIRLRGTHEVSVWINGRESRMNQESLKQYLKTMPANAVKRIEVITNPSARYGGGRPVVNIVTHDTRRENQFLTFGINSSTKPGFTPWVSYIFSNAKWEYDIYANIAFSREVSAATGSDVLLNANGDTSRTGHYRRSDNERTYGSLLSADITFHPDSRTACYLWASVMPTWSRREASLSAARTEYLYQPGDHSFIEHTSKPWGRKPSGGLMDGIWYEKSFDDSTGHMIMLGYYGSLWDRDSLVYCSRQYLSRTQNSISYNQQHKSHEWFHSIEASYLKPFGTCDSLTSLFTNEFEAGTEANLVRSSALISTDTFFNGLPSRCSWLSSQTLSTTSSASLFASLLHRWGRMTIKGGLRGNLSAGNYRYPDVPLHDFNHHSISLTPSVHITYTTPQHHTLALDYSRRATTPETGSYSSRRVYSLDAFSVGNPLLENGASHHLELKWDMYKDGLGSIGINAFYLGQTRHQGLLTDVVLDNQVFHRIVTFSQPVNIGNAWNGGADLHLVYRPNAYLNVRFNSSLFYDYLQLRFREGQQAYSNGLLCYSFRLNVWTKIWNTLQLFGNAYYSSPTQNMLVSTLSRKGVDIGLNADLFHRKLSVNLSVNDLFDQNGWSTANSNPYLISSNHLKQHSRYLSFGITLRFGQMDLEREGRKPRGRASR